MKKRKTAAFSGSRPYSLPWRYNENDPHCVAFKEVLRAELEMVIKAGFTHFITGMGLGAEMMASQIVLELKKGYPKVTLEAAIPFPKQPNSWTVQQRKRHAKLLSICDCRTVISESYEKQVYDLRNKYMVESADILIVAWGGQLSKTGDTVRYAKKKGIPTVIINPSTLMVKR